MPPGVHVIRVRRGQPAGEGWDNDVPVDGGNASVENNVNQHNVVEVGPPVQVLAVDAVLAASMPTAAPQSRVSPGSWLSTATVAGVTRNDGDVDVVRRCLFDEGVEPLVVEGASYAELRGYLRRRMNL